MTGSGFFIDLSADAVPHHPVSGNADAFDPVPASLGHQIMQQGRMAGKIGIQGRCVQREQHQVCRCTVPEPAAFRISKNAAAALTGQL